MLQAASKGGCGHDWPPSERDVLVEVKRGWLLNEDPRVKLRALLDWGGGQALVEGGLELGGRLAAGERRSVWQKGD
jgi:hypothetical protein